MLEHLMPVKLTKAQLIQHKLSDSTQDTG
jgi:hypothetical protein